MSLPGVCAQLIDQHQLHRRRIVVLLGGPSDEREISLRSGSGITDGLQHCGLNVDRLDPLLCPVSSFNWKPDDLAFIALHGRYGEDGQVQQELEELSIRYTGCDSRVSANCFDKLACQQSLANHGIDVPFTLEISSQLTLAQQAAWIGQQSLPVIIKPRRNGSSVGMAVINATEQIEPVLMTLQPFLNDDSLLVQPVIRGEEWTVPFLNDQQLPVVGIRHMETFFSYAAKYQQPKTQFSIVSNDHPRLEDVHAITSKVQQTMTTKGAVRVDVIIPKGQPPVILEVNNIPGMTPSSTLPRSAKAFGWCYEELCLRILTSAL